MSFEGTVILILIIGMLIYISSSSAIIKHLKDKLFDREITIADQKTELSLLTQELKDLNESYKKKQEVSNETQQELSAIASGSTSDSVARLQKPRKSRKSKNSDSSSGI